MKNKIFLFVILFLAVLLYSQSFAQLTGTITIPSSDYPTIAAAIDSLNLQGIGTGGVTFDVLAGHTETAANLTVAITTNPPTAANPIIFQKSGSGANPLITAAPGTSTTLDGIIKLSGTDYITFDGIDVLDPLSNTGDAMMEWGFSLHRVSSTDGSRNVVIKNCNITLQKVNPNSIGIFISNKTVNNVTITSSDSTYANSYNKLFGNSISNVRYGIWVIAATNNRDTDNEIGVAGLAPNNITDFGSNTTSEGIRCEGQSNLKVSKNIVNGGTGTVQTVYGILVTSSGTGTNVANYEISYNRVTITTSTSSYIQFGIRALGTGATVNIHNNIVENSNISASSGTFSTIVHDPVGTTSTANIYNNTVQNNTYSGTGTLILLASTGTITTLNIYSNTITGNSKTGASGSIYCIQTGGANNIECYSNKVSGISIPNSSGTSSSIIYGYYNSASPPKENIYDNNFYNLSVGGTNTSTSTVVAGIRPTTTSTTMQRGINGNIVHGLSSMIGGVYGIYSTGGASIKIFKNNVYNLNNTGSGGTTFGCWVSSGTAIDVNNNFISDLRAPNSTNANAVIGINYTSTTTNSTIGTYYNTVYLDAAGGATFGSSGISAAANATATTAALDMRNNIIVNLSTPGSTSGFTVAYRRSAVNLQNYAIASNNNCLYAGTPAVNRLTFHDGTNSDQNIADYQTRVTPRDVASFAAIPPFENSATTPYDLHIKTTVTSKFESGGTSVSAITTDIDGDLRYGAPGYSGGGTAPDVGADEFEGLPLNPMVYLSTTTTQNTNAIFANTINNHIVGIEIVTTGFSNPLTVTGFTLNTNGSTNAAVDISNTKIFFTGISNTFGTAIQFGSVYASPPAAPTTYSITGSQTLVNGTNYFWLAYDIPLSATGGNVVDAEVLSIIIEDTTRIPAIVAPSGNRTIISAISGAYTIAPSQPFPFNSFNNVAALLGSAGVSGPVTLNVQPGSGPYNEQVEFTAIPGTSGINTVTINGNGETLMFTPTAANRSIVRLNGTKYMSIDSLKIVGNDITYGYGIHLLNQANYNKIMNCTIDLSKITSPTESNSIGIVASSSLTSVTAVGNNANYCLFSNNTIMGGADGGPFRGIRLNGNDGGIEGVGNKIINNIICDFYEEGILLTNTDGTLVISNNINRSKRLTVTIFRGVTLAAGCKNVRIEKNRIHTTNAPTANPLATAYGIHFNSVDALVGSENVAANNMIYNLNSATGIIYGIYNSGSDGAHCFFNSISVDHAGSTAGTTRGFYQTTAASNVVFQNNIISITRGGTGTKHCLYYGTPGSITTSNYNLLYINAPAGTNYVGYLTTNYSTLADWKTTGYDVNSVAGEPKFVSLSDLHIDTTAIPISPASNAGTPITGIIDDFDGDPRNPVTPDIGADEFNWDTEFEPNNTPATANSIGLGTALSATLSPAGDVDWFKFVGPIGHLVVDATNTGNTTDVDLYLYDSTETKMLYNIDRNTNDRLEYNLAYSGTYFINVKGYNYATGPYTLFARIAVGTDPLEPDDGPLFGFPLLATSVPYSHSDSLATIDPGVGLPGFDIDYRYARITAGQSMEVILKTKTVFPTSTLNGGYVGIGRKGSAQSLSPQLFGGIPLASGFSTNGTDVRFVHTVAVTDTYYVFVSVHLQSPSPYGMNQAGPNARYQLIINPPLEVGDVSELPKTFELDQNYPNPFNPSTNIKFALPEASMVTVDIYNILGQKVKTLINEERPAGYHVIEWNGRNKYDQFAGSGVYYIRVSAEGNSSKTFTHVRKMLLLK